MAIELPLQPLATYNFPVTRDNAGGVVELYVYSPGHTAGSGGILFDAPGGGGNSRGWPFGEIANGANTVSYTTEQMNTALAQFTDTGGGDVLVTDVLFRITGTPCGTLLSGASLSGL
jgi:hypothetical protein